MSPDDIIEKQQESITSINNVLPHLPMASVRVLLQKYNASQRKIPTLNSLLKITSFSHLYL